MSRIGKMPISLPKGVQIQLSSQGGLTVKGPKGQLDWKIPDRITLKQNDSVISIERESDQKNVRALHGLTRSLVANMVTGVSEGFVKKLQIVGNGYRAEIDNRKRLVLNVGYSHSVTFEPPEGITIEVDRPVNIDGQSRIPVNVSGIDKELVGHVAASIRAIKKPEVYKPSKGIRYEGERVRNKEGKTRV